MGGSARTYAMIGVAVIAAVAAPYLAGFIAEGMGTLIIGEEAAVLGVEGFAAADAAATAAAETAATVGQVGAGAVTGAASGGINAELAGQDPWTGAFQGALAGGVGSAVSGAVSGLLPEGTPDALKAGVRGATSGFTSAELKGKDLETALKTGLVSGGTAGLTSALLPTGFLSGGQTADDYVKNEEGMFVYDNKGDPILTEDAQTAAKLSALAEKTAQGYGGAYVRQNLSSLFTPTSPAFFSTDSTSSQTRLPTSIAQSPSPGGQQRGDYSGDSGTYGGVSSTGQSTTQGQPGSQALAQALRVGDPSNAGTSVDSPSGGTGSQQNVWNTASLRFKDETGSQV